MAKLLCIFAATAAAPVWAYVVNPRLSHNLCFGRNRAAPALLLSSHLHNVGPDAASSEVGSEVRAEPNFLLLRAEGVSAIAAGRPAADLPTELTVVLLTKVVQMMLTAHGGIDWRTCMFIGSAKALAKAQEIQEGEAKAKVAEVDPEAEPPPLM